MAEPRSTILRRFIAALERRLPRYELSAVIAASMVFVVAACTSDEPGPPIPEDAVRIAQGTSPQIEGLSVGLSSVRGDEAALSVFGHAEEVERIRGRPGDRFELGEYQLEVIDVGEDGDGYATILVTPPRDD